MATELHWNGIYGSAIHDGKYCLFKDRPSGLSFSFDAFSYAKDGYAKRRWQGKSIDLTDPQKEECRVLAEQLADKVLPDPSPPWNPDAIVAFEPNDDLGSVTVYRADGSSRFKDLRMMIQNVPAYKLVVYNEGTAAGNLDIHQMRKGDGMKAGLGLKSWDEIVEMPMKYYNKGGGKKGGDYDMTNGHFYIAANSVETFVYASYVFGFHPDNPRSSEGRVKGNYKINVHIDYNDSGTWTELAKQEVFVDQVNADQPNYKQCWNGTSRNWKFMAKKRGWYRIRYSVKEMATFMTPEMLPYFRFFAYLDTWGDGLSHGTQLSGQIIDSAPEVPIPPTERP